MKNYKSLKAAGKVSVQKQEAAAAVYNDDGSIKTEAVQEELRVVSKSYDSQTGAEQDDYVRVYRLDEVKREIDRCKSQITSLQSDQAEWEQLETDLKAL
jgi:hypothetical protein